MSGRGRCLLALVPLSVLASLVLVTTGSARPAVAATDVEPVAMSLSRLTPFSPTAADSLTVTGTVRNTSNATFTSLRVALVVDTSPVSSRSELAALAASTDRPPGNQVAGPGAVYAVPGDFTPGTSAGFTITVPATALGLDRFGVYPLAVVAYADDTNGTRNRVGSVRTFLPWTGTATVQPTSVAVVWPLVATPAVTAQGVVAVAPLTAELTGRLTTMLQAVRGLPVTWALDGSTLESLDLLATGAPTQPAPSTAPAAPEPAAATFLADLRTSIGRSAVVALPYADPDLVATTRAGLGADLATASTLGPDVVSEALGARSRVSGDVAWPADGVVDPATLAALPHLGARTVLLSSADAPVTRATDWTPSAAGPLAGSSLSVVAVDSTLGALLAATPGPGGRVVAVQRFLAEVALITAELPDTGRTVVVTGPRSAPVDAALVHEALTDLAAAPWAAITDLPAVREGATDGPQRTTEPYPAAARAKEVAPAQLATVANAADRITTVAKVVTSPARGGALVDPYVRAQLRGESTAWRARRTDGAAYARGLLAQAATLQDSVHLVEVGPVTLAARSGRIPVTVANDLTESVTVQLEVVAVPDVRLTVTQPAPVTVGAGERVSVQIPVESNANGSVEVRLRLLTKDGTPYGAVVPFTVQVTGLGAVAELVVGGAMVLLAVALVVRLARAVRRGRRPGSPGSARKRAA